VYEKAVLSQEEPRDANIRMYLIFLETRIIDVHFAADSMGLSSFKFFWWAK